jgi:amino acid adenylation domain-containing protein
MMRPPASAHDLPAPSTILELLEGCARQAPDNVALLAPDRESTSYAVLLDQVERTGRALAAAGIGPGDFVAIVLPPGPEAASAFLGAAAHAAAAPLNPAYRIRELEFFLGDMEARAVITRAGHDAEVRPVAEGMGIPVLSLEPGSTAGTFHLPGEDDRVAHRARPEDVALALHTSGTTSRPKLVPLTHGNLLASAGHIRETLRLTPEDRCLNVMPLFHIHGLMGATMATLAAGGSLVAAPGFLAPRFFPWLEEFSPTWYTAVPTIHQAILARAEKLDPAALPRLRFVRSSSSSLPPTVLTEIERTFRCPVVEAYGMTEAAHQMTCNPLPPARRRPGSVGPAAGPEVAVMDEAGVRLATGEVGEVVIRGPNVTCGYLGNPEANAAAFTDGWFRTGDQGVLDEEGYLTLTGRLKELINRAGEKISPREVDERLLEHPAVAQAVTFAMQHPTLGEDVAAAVVLRPGAAASERELRDFVATALAPFKVPARVVLVSEIPKGPSGKLKRIGLADVLGITAEAGREGPGPVPERGPTSARDEPMLRLFQAVLEDDQVGLEQSFLAAGGDSVLGADLLDRIDADLGEGLTLLDLFEPDATPGRLMTRLEELREELPELAADEPAPGEDLPECVLSPQEEAQWLLATRNPESAAYNVLEAHRIEGPLDPERLARALADVTGAREAFRTNFLYEGGRPRRQVHPTASGELALVDLTELPHRERLEAALARTRDLQEVPFDLECDPLWRFRLFRLGRQDHLFVMVAHHLVSDGWSCEVFRGELSQRYRLLGEEEPPPLLPRNHDLSAVARARHGARHGRAGRDRLAYFHRHLQDAPPVLDLPTDHPRPARDDHRGDQVTRLLDPDLVEALTVHARGAGSSLFMALLATFTAVLHRWTGAEDLVLGTTTAGRDSAASRDLVGLLVNPLPLRIRIDPERGFDHLLASARESVLGALRHAAAPFGDVVRELGGQRVRGAPPVFQALVVFENIPRRPLAFPEARTSRVRVPARTAIMDLQLEIEPEGDALRLDLSFPTALWERPRMEALLDQLLLVVGAVVSEPTRPIGDLPLLAPAEERRVLVEWNASAQEYPRESSIPRLFDEVAAVHPHEVAVAHQGESLTYQQLHRRAASLAQRLTAAGAGPGHFVGILARPDLTTVTSILATTLAGAAYLPLDQDHPEARLAEMLRDSGAQLLVGDPVLAASLEGPGRQVIDPSTATESPLAGEVFPQVGPEDPAYMIYTSGSTGRPKGVVVPQRAVVRMAQANGYLTLAPGQAMAQAASLSYDASVFEIWMALLNGARLEIMPRALRLEPRRLAEFLRNRRVTAMLFSGSHLGAVTREVPDAVACLDTCLVGGEVADPAVLRRVLERGAPRRLLNVYGPTEAGVIVSHATITTPPREPRDIPLGRPAGNDRLYVLDRRGRPLPPGIPGELWIGGDGVATGYWNRPEQTADRFRADPWSPVPGARMYRSGDRVVQDPDGTLHFLGRLDDQVKLWGHRVELGEVEARMAGLPGVAAAAACVRGDGDRARLIGYVVATPGATLSEDGIRDELASILPGFMVPALVVTQDSLPTSASGKLDRSRLPDPTALPPREAAPPLGAMEEALAARFAEVLDGEPPGRDQDFFARGGNSMRVIELLASVERGYGVQVSVAEFMQRPTVMGLATLVEGLLRGEAHAPVERLDAAIEAEQIDRLKKVVHTWQGARPGTGSLLVGRHLEGSRRPLFWCLQSEAELDKLATHLGPDQPIWGMRSGHEVLSHNLEMIPALGLRYANEIQEVDASGPVFLGGNCQAGLIAFHVARELWRRQCRVEVLFLMEVLVAESYPGHVVLLYGRESSQNPYRSGSSPEEIFARSYGAHRVDFLTGGHGQFFESPNVELLATALRRGMDEAEERLGGTTGTPASW